MQKIYKKHFGQHFLKNHSVIRKIIAAVPDDHSDIVEIGPGGGALTEGLLQKFQKVHAIEIDRRCSEALQDRFATEIASGKFRVTNEDVLEYDLSDAKCVIGNLPYNVGTKIIEKFVYSAAECGVFMLQKEVAERILGKNPADFGRLSIFVQAVFTISKILDVGPENFVPKPKVDSTVIKLSRHNKYPGINLQKLNEITKLVFQHRRKKIGHLKNDAIIKMFTENNVDLNLRPENLYAGIFYVECSKKDF